MCHLLAWLTVWLAMEAPWPGPAGAAWWLTGEWQGEDTPEEAASSSALLLILPLLPLPIM